MSPEQNAKMENFWAQVEGRLMAMLEGEKELTLELLNRATMAWLELEHRDEVRVRVHQPPARDGRGDEQQRHSQQVRAHAVQRRRQAIPHQ